MENSEIEITTNTKEIKQAVDNFVKHLESLYDTYPLVTVILRATSFATDKRLQEFLKNKATLKNNDQGEEVFSIDYPNISKFNKLKRKADNSELAYQIIPRNFVVSLISLFDAYVGQLIRAIYLIQPEKLNASEKNLTFSKLLELNSIEEAREYLIEKEVESVLRESHAKQFKWLEEKLDVKLTVDLPSWKSFIEVTERRNLFVHCNGVVSSQYFTVCKQHKVQLPDDLKVGSILDVNEEYFLNAYRCVFDIGVKLSQVIWRKLAPNDTDNADTSIISIIYDLINRGDYQLAIDISDLATHKVFKHHNNDNKLICIINKAQAHKWKGDGQACVDMIKSIDWSACSDKFKLVSATLIEDYPEVYKLMKRMGKEHDEITKECYRDWPIFQELRKHSDFPQNYESVFGEKFEPLEIEDELAIGLLEKKLAKVKKENENGQT